MNLSKKSLTVIIEVSGAGVIVGLWGAFVFDKNAALDGWLAAREQ